MQTSLNRFSDACDNFGLTISTKKTEVMFQPAPSSSYTVPNIYIKSERPVEKFTYLSCTLSRNVHIDDEVNSRIAKASSAFGRLNKAVWDRRGITSATKLSVYRAVVLTTLLYACETWTVYQRHTSKLNHFHTVCLRKILGIRWQDKIPDTEVLNRAKMYSIDTLLRSSQLRWAGHVRRMEQQLLYECPAWRYGNDCLPCYCNRNNTEKCDGVTGNCTCKAGFFGETCDCQTGKHTCDSKTSFCHLNNGKPVCLCKRGISPTPKNNCKDFGLRFIERSAKDRGEVEFYSNGTWNALCILSSRPSEINYNVLNVICRQLGLPEVHIGTYFSKYIPKTNLPDYEIAEASCEGTETSLQACNITVAPALKCNIAVGIQCLAACPEWRYGTGCTFCSCNRTNSDSCDPTTGACKCKSGYSGATCDCLQGNNPCNDTVSECHAQSGKPLCLCKTKFVGRNNYNCTDPIRLANLSTTVTSSGKKLYAGRVELYVNGSWGTVCDDSAYPRSKMTKVMCRNLGLPSIYTDFRKEAYYGQGSGPIHYGYIQCGGTEDTVSQCYTSTTAYCGHHEDLGIICGEECPAFTFGRDCINCQCLQSNTLYCNKTSGECKCKDGFEGQTCSCRKGNHTCELTTSICEKGACYCKYGIKPTSSCIGSYISILNQLFFLFF
ncbi:multiple epidermal growth factor-like domains protein 10 [Saccostrea echinata]|uniref:multiple epidermal growth factor-like domains protein 10 n=1 Tax=Saccostrea echinata TaxID=191078 RepID=UPI002A808218|nr:multiple epidermal growth factor-like domains protein 10 [Saccostrea echinata]